jgi:predicted metal-dependent HD superfamily phosphohydrolase
MSPVTLEYRWTQLMKVLGLAFNQTEHQYSTVVAAYSEKHRVYHNLSHLKHFFGELDAIPDVTPAMQLAVWYHDIIYKPGSKRNESKSARLAVATLKHLGVDDAISIRVAELITLTKTHQAQPDNIEAGYFLDGDMAILGSSSKTYRDYAAAIRQEHRRYPDFLYKPGRKTFLLHALAQDHLFMTESFRERFEQQARTNITAELNALS